MSKLSYLYFTKKKGMNCILCRISESSPEIRENMLNLSNSYTLICKERESLIMAYEHYALFLGTFKDKAIADALITMKRQYNARLELDAFGSKLGQMEEKKLKYSILTIDLLLVPQEQRKWLFWKKNWPSNVHSSMNPKLNISN